MFAERFGSYSIAATLAGTPSFLRLKSVSRKRRLWPPPLWRVVMRPLLLRPPVFLTELVRLFSGFERVTSSKPDTVIQRRPGLVGLNFFRAIRPEPPRRSRSRRLP
jgi:hypothetical protein